MLGPNGAGKSTLLSLLLGLRRPTAGRVLLFGGDPGDPAFRQRVGSTPQRSAVPEALRAREALEIVSAHYVTPTPVDDIIDEFGLGEVARKQCGSLSGGWQRRLAVAMAFVGTPSLVVLDEPTTGLDVEARTTLWDALRARHAAGCTIIVTSHHLEEIEALAQRVVVMDGGRVLADDDLPAVLARVSRRRVALRADVRQLESLDAASDVRASDDGRATVLTADADAFVRELVASGIPFSDLAVRGATLEEAFLTITKGSER
ncbi:ABC transporter ATP-binding protein [Pseudoclavibacter endophyticus]|nr:ABC transporter ATP-binding protein [Pseudoclavibacter endophyticus]